MKILRKLFIFLFILVILLLLYPNIKFKFNNKIYVFSYNGDYSYWEDNMCYQESNSYIPGKNITIKSWDYQNFLFFKLLTMEYYEGNICGSEYLLEEEYIGDFIENARIIENEDNIDLEKMIEGKKPLVGNKRYYTEGDKYQIFYELNGEEKELFVFFDEDLLIIQVGLSDEGPKFIAYE